MIYRLEIDGLRALAVISVIFSHSGIDYFSNGYVGVDIFFVISGYLISLHALPKFISNRFNIWKFYEKRCRRILPLLFLVITISTCFSIKVLWPVDLLNFTKSALSSLAFFSNIYFWLDSGYFAQSSLLKPLIHTWSLSLEEQFYLFFPFILIVAGARIARSSKLILPGLLLAILASLVAYVVGINFYSNFTYYSTITRVWEILVGIVIGYVQFERNSFEKEKNHYIVELYDFISVLLIIVAIFYETNNDRVSFIPTIVAVIGTAMLLVNDCNNTFTKAALSIKPVTYIGLISYSLYLWHQPVLSFYRLMNGVAINLEDYFEIFLIILFLSITSYELVEKKFRNERIISLKAFGYTLSITALILILTYIFIFFTNGLEKIKLSTLSVEESRVYESLNKLKRFNLLNEVRSEGCNIWTPIIDQKFIEKFQECAGRHGKAKIIIGDSHAINIYNIFNKFGSNKFLVGISSGGCIVKKENCFYGDFIKFIRSNNSNVEVIIFNQAGYTFLKNSRDVKAGTDVFINNANYFVNIKVLDDFNSYISGLSLYSKVIWLGPFYEPWTDYDRQISFAAKVGFTENPKARIISQELDSFLEDYASKRLNNLSVSYINLNRVVNLKSIYDVDDNCFIYFDYDHLSPCGELEYGKNISISMPALLK